MSAREETDAEFFDRMTGSMREVYTENLEHLRKSVEVRRHAEIIHALEPLDVLLWVAGRSGGAATEKERKQWDVVRKAICKAEKLREETP